MTPPEGKPKFGRGGAGCGAEVACAAPAGALWCAVLTRAKPRPMPAPRHRMPVPSPRRLYRRIGVAAAATALLVQLVVVFAPMPPAAGAAPRPTIAGLTRDRAAAPALDDGWIDQDFQRRDSSR